MKKLTPWHIILCGLLIASDICFGMNDEERRVVGTHVVPKKDLSTDNIRNFTEPARLSSLMQYDLIVRGDSIVAKPCDGDGKKIKLYAQKNIKKIYDALSKRKSFVVEFIRNNAEPQKVKIQEYRSGSFLWWDGWMPHELHLVCLGMRELLGTEINSNPIVINLDQDKESKSSYKKNGYIAKTLVAVLMALIAYQFRDKIFSLISRE